VPLLGRSNHNGLLGLALTGHSIMCGAQMLRRRQSVRQASRQTERGQAIGEYMLLVALIGVSLVLVLALVSKAASRAYHQSTVSLEHEVPNYGSSGSGGAGGGAGGGGGGVVLVGSSGGGGGGVKVPPASDSDSTGSGESNAPSDAGGRIGNPTAQEANTAQR
jgi:Flp pilus assembly pilin Flp